MDFNRSVLVWDYFCSNRNRDSILDATRKMIPIVYILINLLQAVWHSFLINQKNILIKSGQKIAEYSILSLLAGVILKAVLGCKLLPLILFCLLSRLAFYDPFLNVLRGLPIAYEGEIR